MKEVNVTTRTTPARPRSGNYVQGTVVSGGGGGTTVISGETVDIVQTEDTKTLTDQNVLSSARSVREFIQREGSQKIKALIDFLNGLLIAGKQANDIAVADDQGNEEKVKDTVMASTAWTKAEIEELDDKFLRKDQPDQTDHLVKFLGGLNVGEFIDSLLAGKGIGLFPDGRAQVSRLEVRDALVVMRLLINEIQAMAGDFSFSDAGCIQKVEDLGDGTYKLWMEKRTEFDVTNFGESDVMYSIVNNLLTGGKDYYTSWFRCLTRNVNDNTLTVVLYPDSEVPGGKNYPPVAGYNVTRRGNAVMPDEGEAANERAQSWLLSSREGRILFLQNVYKPILEDYNYAVSIGKLPDIKALEKLPVTTQNMGVVAETIIAEKFYQFDYNGDVVPNKVDRGEWSLEVAQSEQPYRNVQHERLTEAGTTYTLLEQHTVYHYGCKWGCLIDKTQLEPQWNSPGWVLLEGDKNYTVQFVAPGTAKRGRVNLDITAWVQYGNRDITDLLLVATGTEVEWLRDSGNTPSDNSWSPVYVDGKKNVIHIDNSDEHGVGMSFGYEYDTVKFICRVTIPVGSGTETIENYVGFRM